MSNIQGLLEKYKAIKDERFFADVFDNEEYKLVKNKKYGTVLDIGACAGEFSAYIYDDAEKIYALEPFPPHFKELEDNVREFQLDKIKPFKLALGSSNGEAKLSTLEDRGSNRLLSEDEPRNSIMVQTKTLATFMKDEGIDHVDLLKIDIEGGENVVFSGDFDSVKDKIDYIVGEHLPDNLREYGFVEKVVYRANRLFEREK